MTTSSLQLDGTTPRTDMARTIWHIGYPKCASTSLQRNFFAISPSLNYVSVHVPNGQENDFSRDPRSDAFFRSLQSVVFDSTRSDALWDDHVRHAISSQGVTVISHELILNSSRTLNEKIDFIRSRGRDPVIFILYREPHEIIRSYYDYIPYDAFGGDSRTVLDIKTWINKCRSAGDRFIWEALRFERIFPGIEEKLPGSMIISLSEARRNRSLLASFFGVPRVEIDNFFAAPPENAASSSGLKKFSRRLLRRKRPSDFLSRRKIEYIERITGRIMPSTKSRLDDASLQAIRQDFQETYAYLEARRA
ncbi:MAG: hypothetical protein V2I43_03480 [Parvularcula sp.]|jgi:hypothetical protein|nr:hypothetical protein [Parvularcula sp.]